MLYEQITSAQGSVFQYSIDVPTAVVFPIYIYSSFECSWISILIEPEWPARLLFHTCSSVITVRSPDNCESFSLCVSFILTRVKGWSFSSTSDSFTHVIKERRFVHKLFQGLPLSTYKTNESYASWQLEQGSSRTFPSATTFGGPCVVRVL